MPSVFRPVPKLWHPAGVDKDNGLPSAGRGRSRRPGQEPRSPPGTTGFLPFQPPLQRAVSSGNKYIMYMYNVIDISL